MIFRYMQYQWDDSFVIGEVDVPGGINRRVAALSISQGRNLIKQFGDHDKVESYLRSMTKDQFERWLIALKLEGI